MEVICNFFNKIQHYSKTWLAMQEFTKNRNVATKDEFWFLEHYPIFTQGLAGQDRHLLYHSDIKVIRTDRGGQITYHGPGQLVVYFLLDLKRKSLSLKKFIAIIQQAIIELLIKYGIVAETKIGVPGIYVNEQKICSIGLKISKGCTYHGLSLNVNMDLEPFNYINPCGYQNLKMTQLSKLKIDNNKGYEQANFSNVIKVASELNKILIANLNYKSSIIKYV